MGLIKKNMGLNNAESGDRPDNAVTVNQKTIKNPINCTGIALHSGDKVSMTLLPGKPDSGIVFKRTDVVGNGAVVSATWDRVVDTRMCTTIGNGDGVSIATVEHLMAALAGCGIDNAIIEINGPEVPIMDGSAAPFVFLVECAGVVEQDAPRRFIKVLKPIEVREGNTVTSLVPGKGFSLGFEINFDNTAVSRQAISLGLVNGTFKKELSRARTFGFLHEVDQLRASGLAKGGSLDNAVVVSGNSILNKDGLRYENEFVRHKVLDAVGDLYLAGAQIIGRFDGSCSGHAANRKILEVMFSQRDAWSYCTMSLDESEPKSIAGVWERNDEPEAAAIPA